MNIYLPAAILAGALIAVQATILGAFGERLNPLVASTWVHAGGLVFAVVLVAASPRMGFEIAAVREAPWGLLAGVLGVILVAGIATAVAGLGLASTLAVVVGAQILTGFTIELSGLTARVVSFDPLRIVGALLIVSGVYLVVSRAPGTT